MNYPLPRTFRVRQNFPESQPLDLGAVIAAELERIASRIKPGARIAVGVGSRGITNIREIVSLVLAQLRAAGAQPFVIPAMGSHGGATPDGQREVLASYGITEETMGVPIRAAMEVRRIGTSKDGVDVFCSVEALAADGIVLVNRIKPHTDFFGTLGSGIMKMSVIGLGKRAGATAMHAAAMRIGYERAIRGMAHVVLQAAPVLCGVAILENQFHETAKVVLLPREEIETGEDALLTEARKLMPLLPFEGIDLLIVDRLGKNISGAGIDPNVIGRSVHGYSSSLMREEQSSPFIQRIFVRDLTPETHGNAIGIGLADVTTSRLVAAMDHEKTYINAITALTPLCAKIPIYFDTDREAIERVLASLGGSENNGVRMVRIADTLSLANLELSESFRAELTQRSDLTVMTEPGEMQFDAAGNLNDLTAI